MREKETTQIIAFILNATKTREIESTQQLVDLVQEKFGVPHKVAMNLLIQLEDEGQLCFVDQPQNNNPHATFIFSKKTLWYWTTIIFAIVAIPSILFIGNLDYPMVYLRIIFGSLFILFIPGYAFTKLLFPSIDQKTGIQQNQTAIIENYVCRNWLGRLTLSICLSIALTAIVGLILSFTPWGVSSVSATLSLLALALIFSTWELLNEYTAKSISN